MDEIYEKALNNSTGGFLLSELSVLNFYRSQWLKKNMIIKYIYSSTRLVPYVSIVKKYLKRLENSVETASHWSLNIISPALGVSVIPFSYPSFKPSNHLVPDN
jgi:hypothetical protein